jgi:hypothetical protein
MDHNQVTRLILHRENLEGYAAFAVAQEQDPIRFGRIIFGFLSEGQTAVGDDEADAVVGDPVLAGGIDE